MNEDWRSKSNMSDELIGCGPHNNMELRLWDGDTWQPSILRIGCTVVFLHFGWLIWTEFFLLQNTHRLLFRVGYFYLPTYKSLCRATKQVISLGYLARDNKCSQQQLPLRLDAVLRKGSDTRSTDGSSGQKIDRQLKWSEDRLIKYPHFGQGDH